MKHLIQYVQVLKIQTEQGIIDLPIKELRQQEIVRLPDGLTKVGSLWFSGARMESVEIPASVRVIEANAFRNCTKLRYVYFAKGSKLEVVEDHAFGGTALKSGQVLFPPNTQVSPNVFV